MKLVVVQVAMCLERTAEGVSAETTQAAIRDLEGSNWTALRVAERV